MLHNHSQCDSADDSYAHRDAFSEYVAAARKVNGRTGRTAASSTPKRENSEELAKIREWAHGQGLLARPHPPGRPRGIWRCTLAPLPRAKQPATPRGGRLLSLTSILRLTSQRQRYFEIGSCQDRQRKYRDYRK